MTADNMARELRAAGWFERYPNGWVRPGVGIHEWHRPILETEDAWKELARGCAQGTVTKPMVGEEDAK